MAGFHKTSGAEGGLPRSPELMDRDDTAVLVVDAQEKLLGVVAGEERVLWNIRRLVEAAGLLGMRVAATLQNPEKLGPLAAPLDGLIQTPVAKMAFSCGACPGLFEAWPDQGIERVLICGVETHVCIQQTAFDLTAAGLQAYVAVDAVGARHAIDHDTALRRMETAGIVLTSTDAAMFEWCRVAGTSEFRQISALARETPP
jgi:nicotinamidase-related amidase